MERRVTVLVVDDSAVYRQAIREALTGVDGVEVIGTAKDGLEALKKIREHDPDAITLDFEMPQLDGIRVLEKMRQEGVRAKAVMVSSCTELSVKLTTDALMKGAFDFILKPSGGTPEENRRQLQTSLVEAMQTLAQSKLPLPEVARPRAREIRPSGLVDAVVIGSSTGGPIALRKIVPELPGDLNVPVIIVQHMPEAFTGQLARHLDSRSALRVSEIVETTVIESGHVYLATGGQHSQLVRENNRVLAKLTSDPPENHCRPAIDFTLRSAVEVYGSRLLSVILTGMGKDGLAGCREVASVGGRVFAQHPSDCAVYGMPKVVVEDGLAHAVLRTDQMATEISRISGRSLDRRDDF